MIHRHLTTLILTVTALGALFMAALCVYRWDFFYNSDLAMIGLMAKRLLDHGEVPIFVWSVGYQGVLLEVSLVAFFYKIFGIHPWVLNLAPALLYFPLVYFFYRALAESYDRLTASIGALFLVLSNAELYGFILRTQPNYTETFLYGTILVWLYLKLSKRITPGAAAAFGFFAGFGFYTYGQVAYFLGAIAIHLLLRYLRDLRNGDLRSGGSPSARPARQWVRDFFFPPLLQGQSLLIRAPLVLLNWIAVIDLTFGVVTFLIGLEEVHVSGKRIAWMHVAAIWDAMSVILPLNLARAAWLYRDFIRRHLRAWVAMGIAALLGYAPKLYYRFVLKGFTINRMGISGSLSEVRMRMKWLIDGNLRYLNLVPSGFWHLAIGAVTLAAILYALYESVAMARAYVLARRPADTLNELSPFLFVLPAVVALCVSASAFGGADSSRYSLALWLFYAAAFARVGVEAFRRVRPAFLRAGVALLGLALLANNVYAIRSEFARLPERPAVLDLVQALRARGIRYGYADYWLAYTIDLYTLEDIVIEPISSFYCPYYGPIVAQADRLAYLDNEPSETGYHERPEVRGGVMKIRDVSYKVMERLEIRGSRILVLEREKAKLK